VRKRRFVANMQGRPVVGRGGPAPPDDERHLLAAARSGDPAAFVDLLRRHDRLLRLVAWQVLGDRDLMDDALQEVAMKAWCSLDGFRGDAAISTWLARLAYNSAVDLLRRLQGRRFDAASDNGTPLWVSSDTGADPSERVAEQDALRAAFACLPPDQRITVMLVEREGYDYETVARVLGVRPGTVASRLSRARASLRAALEPARRA
jgi:RNA polymerase sigma-70 factor, ECF subfamily